jgi:hypothetical protein
MEQKAKDLLEYSDPDKVLKNAIKYLGKSVELYVSPLKNKKYMVQDPSGKWVHFGYFGMEDHTRHLDEERRRKFRQRNSRWADSPKWSPSYLSYYLLW